MKYTMTRPCHECPFLLGSGFTYHSLMQHASGPFACHKTCELVDGTYQARNHDTPHCAGALIFLEKQNRPHQMMRIAERLGMYDHTRLDMMAAVGSSAKDYRAEPSRRRKKSHLTGSK